MKNPNSLSEAIELLGKPDDLRAYLRARLLLLAGLDQAYAVRAIEMLLSMPPEDSDADLSGISTPTLEEVVRRMEALEDELN